MSATKNRSISLAVCLLGLTVILSSCGAMWLNPHNAEDYLLNHGYTDVVTSGHRDMLCGHNGPGAVGFTAKKDGRKVSGAVCENFGGGFMIVEE